VHDGREGREGREGRSAEEGAKPDEHTYVSRACQCRLCKCAHARPWPYPFSPVSEDKDQAPLDARSTVQRKCSRSFAPKLFWASTYADTTYSLEEPTWLTCASANDSKLANAMGQMSEALWG
jgi:hypothetical protein